MWREHCLLSVIYVAFLFSSWAATLTCVNVCQKETQKLKRVACLQRPSRPRSGPQLIVPCPALSFLRRAPHSLYHTQKAKPDPVLGPDERDKTLRPKLISSEYHPKWSRIWSSGISLRILPQFHWITRKWTRRRLKWERFVRSWMGHYVQILNLPWNSQNVASPGLFSRYIFV